MKLEEEFGLTVNGGRDEITDRGRIEAAALQDSDMQAGKLSEGEIFDINEESACDEKDDAVPGEVMPATHFMIKELLKLFHSVERTEDGILEADLNLERRFSKAQKKCLPSVLSYATSRRQRW